jgi:hypothetical protein
LSVSSLRFAMILWAFCDDPVALRRLRHRDSGKRPRVALEGSGHDAAAGERDARASRVRNLGNQAVGVKAAEEASHLSRSLARVGSEGNGGARELEPQAAIGEAVKRMFATEECLEQHAVVARERIERADGSSVGRGGSRAQGVESADRAELARLQASRFGKIPVASTPDSHRPPNTWMSRPKPMNAAAAQPSSTICCSVKWWRKPSST